MSASLLFKVASEDWEFEAIHRLNHRTFVEEIPQHAPREDKRLVDKFHAENTYVVCLSGRRLVAMVALRANRPFSLDQKLSNLDYYLPKARSIVEIRLLSVEPEYRNSRVLSGLLQKVFEIGSTSGYDLAIVSGTVRQLRLYGHLGFVPFGPRVGTPDALYQPMYLTRDAVRLRGARGGDLDAHRSHGISFLPGPVEISTKVRRALSAPAVSHRGPGFLEQHNRIIDALCELVNARHTALFLGSGTLANDVVAGQISLLRRKGIVLSNGEFGDRLIDHAVRFGLEFDIHRTEWTQPFDETALRARMRRSPRYGWLWAVHSETSTGVLNDISMLVRLCEEHEARPCLDCISSVGVVRVDLSGVFLATGASGKGLAAYPGLSMVFFNHDIPQHPTDLPRYLDIGLYANAPGVPFTQSSNLVAALGAALEELDMNTRGGHLLELSRCLREGLSRRGFQPIAAPEVATPAILTLAPPHGLDAGVIGELLEKAGFMIAFRSDYLRRRNWIQICVMGELGRSHVNALLEAVDLIVSGNKSTPGAESDVGLRKAGSSEPARLTE